MCCPLTIFDKRSPFHTLVKEEMNKFRNQVNKQKLQGEMERRLTDGENSRTNQSHLPHDLIFEILSRLPPKAISKFRCVSKQWYHLLTDDREFSTRHNEWSEKNPILLIRRYVLDENGEMRKNKPTIELTSVNMKGDVNDRFKIVVDGPVHTFSSYGHLSILCSMNSLYVCNPSFHEFFIIPFSSVHHVQNTGIGYAKISSEYKIVHLFEETYRGDGYMDCEILTFREDNVLTTNSWRRLYGVCPKRDWKFPVCVSGIIYWGQSSRQTDKSILSFDLEEEEFSIIDYPACDSETYSFLEFTAIEGSLFVFGCSAKTSTMDVWRLDKDEKTWVAEHCISVFPFSVNFIVSSDNRSEEIVMHTDEKGLLCYNIKTWTSRRIKYFEGVRSYNKPCLHHYTLSPLNTTITSRAKFQE